VNIRKLWFILITIWVNFDAISQTENPIETGDFLFLDLDCGPLCDAIESVTVGYEGNHFSHVGLVFKRNDSVFVLEAIGNSVRLTGLPAFLKYSFKPAYHARLKKNYRSLIPKAILFSLSILGYPYDDAFVYDNGKYYCSELIYDAFKEANGGKPFFKLQPMTYKKPGSEEFDPAWVSYFDKLGLEIPEGKPGCNPGGISLSEKIDVLGIFPGK